MSMESAARDKDLPHRKTDRIDYLDAIRGLAALSVFFWHFGNNIGWLTATHYLKAPFNLFIDGGAAVSMFFVLSGTVLSLKYLRSTQSVSEPQLVLARFSFPAFFVTRFCRIWIPYVVTLLGVAVIHRLIYPHISSLPECTSQTKIDWATCSSPYQLFRQAILISPYRQLEVTQSWTLGIELVISLAVPAMAFIAAKSLPWLLTLAAVVWLAQPYGSFLSYSFLFLLGTGISKVWHKIEVEGRWTLSARIGMLIVAVGCYTYIRPVDTMNRVGGDIYYINGIGAALLLMFVISTPSARKILSAAPLRHLGRVSYGLYLLHFAVIYTVAPAVLAVIRFMPSPLKEIIAGVISLFVSLVLADQFYRHVEVPSVGFGRWLISRYRLAANEH